MTTTKENAELSVQVMIQPSVKAQLKKLAEKNGRSLSGECRFALTQYAKKAKA
jgi:hypothetical protein